MNEVRTNTRLKVWPSPQDYNEAIQELRTNTSDPSLRNCSVEVNALGLPMPRTGAFASVYKVQSQASCHALRCFLRDISDQEQRYALISDFVQNDSLPYTVTFHYLSEGLRVNGRWYPALKMDWVTGLTLDMYVERNIGTPLIPELADKFKQMCFDLQRDGIAHGDLQHGNIIICDGELRLVDYDGMFVPGMQGFEASELGHRNYQHPAREGSHFDATLDNFSAWVIYTSLRAMAIDPSLYNRLRAGDDCLLFRKSDFVHPESSTAFSVLEHHDNEELRTLGKLVRWLCTEDPRKAPALSDSLPEVPDLPEIKAFRPAPTVTRMVSDERPTGLPDWIADGVQTVVPRQLLANVAPNAVSPNYPELGHPVPRLVEDRSDPSIAVILAVLLGLVGILTTFHGFLVLLLPLGLVIAGECCDRAQERRLIQSGGLTTGQIVNIDQLTRTMTYQYDVQGFLNTGSRQISHPQEQLLGGRTELAILYNPTNPKHHIIYDFSKCKAVPPLTPAPKYGLPAFSNTVRTAALTTAPPLSGASPGAPLAVPPPGQAGWQFEPELAVAAPRPTIRNPHDSGSGNFSRDHDLVQFGFPARATILNKSAEQEPWGRRYVYTVEYSFHYGTALYKCKTTVTSKDYYRIQPTEEVTVLYDPRDPGNRNVIYRLSAYLAAPLSGSSP